MSTSTTIRVSQKTRDTLHALASDVGQVGLVEGEELLQLLGRGIALVPAVVAGALA